MAFLAIFSAPTLQYTPAAALIVNIVYNYGSCVHYFLSAQGACSFYELWNGQMLGKRDHVFCEVTTSWTQGFDANIANSKRQRIVRLDKVYCPVIFGNDGSYIANVQCSLPHSQFAMLGNAKFMHHSRRTLCRGFVSCGQQPPAEQVMRHNITYQRECTCQVTLKFDRQRCVIYCTRLRVCVYSSTLRFASHSSLCRI